MNVTERTTAVGVFVEQSNAERAIQELLHAGFTNEQLGFVARGRAFSPAAAASATSTDDVADIPAVVNTVPPVIVPASTPGPAPAVTDTAPHDSIAGYSRAEATAAGVAGGGLLGGILGAAASLLIPGLGPAIAGGVLAAIFGGAVIGAVAGGFVGALIQMGIPEEEAHYYQEELNAGRVIVTVRAGARYLEAINILRQNGAYDATMRYLDANTPSAENLTGEPGQANVSTMRDASSTYTRPNSDRPATSDATAEIAQHEAVSPSNEPERR